MLVHKSVYIRPEVWKKLKLAALVSGFTVRDYLTYLIEQAEPIELSDQDARSRLEHIATVNDEARQKRPLQRRAVNTSNANTA